MFQFTTTTVINSSKDLTTGKALWSAQEATDDTPASFNIKRVNNFIADNVTAIYKAVASEAEFAKATIDLSQVNGTEGDLYRLNIYIGLSQGSQDSRYSNDLIYKGKPISVEFQWLSDTATTVEKLVNTINKYDVMVYGEKLLNVTYSGTCITIEATNEYLRFKVLNIELFDSSAYHGVGDYTVVRSLDDLTEVDSNDQVSGSAEGYFVGKEGFGTYAFILHNLRIPTSARTRAFAQNQDESPIPGATYNQYTIHYCVKRGVLGTNAVGDLVTTKTTHVFYVLSSLCTDFEASLAVLGDIIEVSE